MRLIDSSKEIDIKEAEWWEKFSEVEERFCWVQGKTERKILKSAYVKKMMKFIKKEDRVLDFGCGIGWLLIEMAKKGYNNLIGIDFSEDQIERANQLAFENNLSSNVRFLLGDYSQLDIGNVDVVVLHALLHHLSRKEIENLINSINKILNDDGRIIILEPFFPEEKRSFNFIQKLISKISWKIILGVNRRPRLLNKCSKEEDDYRKKINSRKWGIDGRGCSPKEIAFFEDELTKYLHGFKKIFSKKYFFISHITARELLLRELTYPKLTKISKVPSLIIVKSLEQLLLFSKAYIYTYWVFTLRVLKKINTI